MRSSGNHGDGASLPAHPFANQGDDWGTGGATDLFNSGEGWGQPSGGARDGDGFSFHSPENDEEGDGG